MKFAQCFSIKKRTKMSCKMRWLLRHHKRYMKERMIKLHVIYVMINNLTATIMEWCLSLPSLRMLTPNRLNCTVIFVAIEESIAHNQCAQLKSRRG